MTRRVSYMEVANNIVPDNCSSVIAPALLYYRPSMDICVVLGLCSRLDSTDSIHGIIITGVLP